MGALYGFSGPPDHTLTHRMGKVLAHRGSGPTRQRATNPGTICYLPRFEADVGGRLGAGLYGDEHGAVALAGYLTNAGDFAPHPEGVLPALLAGFRSRGTAFLTALRGAFILVVCDGDRVFLARDGAGVRTAYYACFDGRFRFAVEPKGILADPGFERRIRPAAVAQYLTFSFIPGRHTMLAGLYEVPAGHVVCYTPGREPELERYFYFEHETGEPGPGAEDEAYWVRRFDRDFSAAVAERLPTGEDVGVFLSGGIDSSVVASEVTRRHSRPVKTYAIHFGPRYAHELDFARVVAERCGTEHEEVLIRPKGFLPRLRQIIWHLDDPIGDPITVPNYELSRRVSRDVRWVFNGEGGDPCFGGPKNVPMMLHHWYGGIERTDDFRERMYLASYRRAYDELDYLLTPEWRQKIDYERDLVGVLSPFFKAAQPAGFLEKLLAINIRLKGAHLILPKVERMTGAWGITPLAPLFDERMLRLSFQLPGRLKLAGGIEKIVLKRAFADRLPQAVIDRPKSGMRVPVHFWFQKELKRYARKILSKKNIERVGIFDPDRVKSLLAYDTLEGPGRYGLRLWMLLTFEIWRRIVVEGEPL